MSSVFAKIADAAMTFMSLLMVLDASNRFFGAPKFVSAFAVELFVLYLVATVIFFFAWTYGKRGVRKRSFSLLVFAFSMFIYMLALAFGGSSHA